MADPVGLISLLYDVSKDGYKFSMIANGRDDDLKGFRAQLLSLRVKSGLIKEALGRESIKAEDKSKVDAAIVQCKTAAEQLELNLAKFKDEPQANANTTQGQNQKDTEPALAKLFRRLRKGLETKARKAAWPFQKPAMDTLSAHLQSCHNMLDGAIELLHLNVGISHLERLHEMDKNIIQGNTSLDQAFQDIMSLIDQKIQSILEELARQNKLVAEEQDQAKAEELVNSLWYPEMESRGKHIDNQSPNTDYAWLFTSEAWGIQQVLNLIRFLYSGTGLFWISGEAASGKSSLMYYLSKPWRRGHSIWRWDGTQEVVIACHCCWVAGTDMQKSQRALLQSLLYYILYAQLDIIPTVCQARWKHGTSKSPWSVSELLTCLEVAIDISYKRLCIFVDGLDELQPERDHHQVVEKLKHLSSHGNVKMLVSSRPWSAFGDLAQEHEMLQMNLINRRSIIGYLKTNLGHLKPFSRVSWSCVGESRCGHMHWSNHGKPHLFLRRLVDKADGNFLWITLVADTIRTRLGSHINDL